MSFFKKLQEETSLPSFSAEISWDEFFQGYKKWAEKMTTSHSGQNLGHIKVLQVRDIEDTDGVTTQILNVHHQMLSVFIRTGYAPERWKKCISCAIEKDPGTPKILRLQIIHIYENNLNLMTKLLWGKSLSNMLKNTKLLVTTNMAIDHKNHALMW